MNLPVPLVIRNRALWSFHLFSSLPKEIQIHIWELVLRDSFHKTSFDDLSRFEYGGSYRSFLQSPFSHTQIDMDTYCWKERLPYSWHKCQEMSAQKIVLGIAHVHHLSRQIVLGWWLKCVERKKGKEGEEGRYERMMRERLMKILKEMLGRKGLRLECYDGRISASPLKMPR